MAVKPVRESREYQQMVKRRQLESRTQARGIMVGGPREAARGGG
jgi:hypothetical protein